jgi:hypothetical protein
MWRFQSVLHFREYTEARGLRRLGSWRSALSVQPLALFAASGSAFSLQR